MQKTAVANKAFLLVILLLSVFIYRPLTALDPAKAVSQYVIDQWTDESGLPQTSVHTVLQTSDGYLWLGTEEGLTRFDGVRFQIFDNRNTPEMSIPVIQILFEDSFGNLWIGTLGGGVLKYQGGIFKQYGPKQGLTGLVVTALCESEPGEIWVGTDPAGVFRYSPALDKFKNHTVENGLAGDTVRDIFKDRQGNIWIGTTTGLSLYKDGNFAFYAVMSEARHKPDPKKELKNKSEKKPGAPDEKPNSEPVNVIFQDSSDKLWFGTVGGLYHMEAGAFIEHEVKPDFASLDISEIMEDKDKSLWIATKHSGLIRYCNNRFSTLLKKEGTQGDWILSVKEDREGNLWVGTSYSGLFRIKDEKFTTITTTEGLSDNVVFSIYQDKAKNIWIGTNNGLNRYRDGTFKYLTTQEGLTNNAVNSILVDDDGAVWAGTDSGLNRMDNAESNRFRVEKYFEDFKDKYVPALIQDRDGHLWVGTLQGAFRFTGSKMETFTDKNGLATRFVNFLLQDRKGGIWFSNIRGGLTHLNNGKFTIYNRTHGLAADSLNSIYEDGDGVLWFGSNNGLSRYKDGKFTTFTRQDGLFNNNIYQVLEGPEQDLWLSSNKGIFRVYKADLEAIAQGGKTPARVQVFNKDDGMKSSECNGGYMNAGTKTQDGRLWFPTLKGVVVIDPANIRTNKTPPPVYIEEILLDGNPVTGTGRVEVQPGIKRLEFRYTALSFVNPDKVRFKYKLQGFDETWVDPGSLRSAFYTNLDGGDYRFRVAACNNDGLWNESGAFGEITVIPPFFRTWWFIMAALMLFAFMSYAVIHFFRKYISLATFWKKQQYIGPFRILDKIGSGGMGTIYKAVNQNDKTETVALKVLREDLFEDENNRKRFKQEATIIDQLEHPNIVKVLERGQTGQNLFIAMELLEGQTLAMRIRKARRLELKESAHIMQQTADALLKIHQKGIIHRDLKPDNIMLIKQGNDSDFVKLLDFGLAQMQHQTRLTQTGMVIGTINYMAPEQISGRGSFPDSDIYSLGIIFYEMITGEKPFFGETTIDIMKQILDKSPIEPIRYNFDISFELNRLIMRMLEKEKSRRPKVDEVVNQLRIIQADIRSAETNEKLGLI